MQMEPISRSSLTGADEIIVAPATFFKPGEFGKSSEEAFKKAKKFVSRFKDVPIYVKTGAIAIGTAVINAPKAIIESGKKAVEAIKNTKIGKFMKESLDAYDRATKKK